MREQFLRLILYENVHLLVYVIETHEEIIVNIEGDTRSTLFIYLLFSKLDGDIGENFVMVPTHRHFHSLQLGIS